MLPARLTALVTLLALGASVPAPAEDGVPHRIVSLLPSLTEDLFAIGAGGAVVGVSEFTVFPPAATRLPVVTGSAAVDAERIVQLHPDVVVGIEAQAAPVADVRKAGLRTVLLRDDGFDDIFRDIEALGLLTAHVDQARALNDKLQARTTALMRTVRKRAHKPRVFVVLGAGPIYTAGGGSYVGKLIALAGGANAANITDAYGAVTPEALLAAQPDLLVADPTVQLSAVRDQAPWNALHAVRVGRIATVPDPAILERPGPRYNEGLAWLIRSINALP